MADKAAAMQFVRFLVGGLLTLTADFGTFTILYNFGTPLFVASTVSLAAGFAVSFAVNRLWVFDSKGDRAEKRTTMQLVLYSSLFLFNILFTYAFISYTQSLGLNAYVAKAITILLILVWNFLLYRKFIFAVKPKA